MSNIEGSSSLFDDDVEKQDLVASKGPRSSQKQQRQVDPLLAGSAPPQEKPRGPPQRKQSRVPGAVHQGGPPGTQKGGPPPAGSQQRPPGPPRTKSQQQREKNERFQDVDKTGSWGKISRKEMIVVGVIVLLMVGGAIAAVLVFVVFKDNPSTPPPPTEAPTTAPSARLEVDPAVQFPVLLDTVKASPFTNTSLPSESLSYYTAALASDASQPAPVRALSWILHEDPRDPAPDNPFLVLRYVLASMYYALGGETSWTNPSNAWLTGEHACDWHGVNCDRFNTQVLEIDLDSNGLQGSIPNEMALLTDLRSLVFSKNELTGTIPSRMLGSLPFLSILFVNDNNLQGDLEDLDPLRDNGVLSTLMIQQNNITGRWPRDFCPRTGEPNIFVSFSLDCYEDTRCLCCGGNNCY